MSQARHGKPDAYVTNLIGTIAGEDQCHFAPWYLARFWVKNERDFDLAGWLAEHDAMLARRAEELRTDNYQVYVEKQNAFAWIGRTAKVSGKPDILAMRPRDKLAKVSDVKTGQRRKEHYWQVLFYMLALPRVRPDLEGYIISGELVYKDGRVDIEPHELTQEAAKRMTAALVEVGFNLPPEKTPSETECTMCKLGVADCPEKGKVGPKWTAVTTDF